MCAHTLHQFHVFGFKSSLLIVDGASTNLTCLKLLVGTEGTFSHNEQQEDPHSTCISANTINPFTGKKMYMIICPSSGTCMKTIEESTDYDHYTGLLNRLFYLYICQ